MPNEPVTPGWKRRLKRALVVSCQASPGDPMEDVDVIRRMARAVAAAGASGLRLNSPGHIAAIRQDTSGPAIGLPIIGIQKQYRDGRLYITPDFTSAAALAKAGASLIAVDCTRRPASEAVPWPALIRRIHDELRLPVLADIATLEEALDAVSHGADLVAPTLRGYTPGTAGRHTFDWELLDALVHRAGVPVVAEGHIATPREARRALDRGAWSVVVGSAITRPGHITQTFLQALRPPGIEASSPGAPILGVDIGGTSVKAALVGAGGQILHPAQTPTRAAGGRDAIAAALVDAIEQVLNSSRSAAHSPAGIGIASAGVFDAGTGSVFAATDNLPQWTGFPLRAFAEERFHLPCRVVNDAQAAALAELHFGRGRGRRSFVALTIGTGIGGGLVLNGKLVRGARGFGGTLGHHVVCAGGRRCNCGRQGCLEAYVSTAALIEEYRQLGGRTTGAAENDPAELALHISRMAVQGDPAAKRAYGVITGYLAEGIANIFNIVDPEAVILSGGLIAGQPGLLPALREQVVERLHFGSVREPHIELSGAGQYAGVQGAAALFIEDD